MPNSNAQAQAFNYFTNNNPTYNARLGGGSRTPVTVTNVTNPGPSNTNSSTNLQQKVPGTPVSSGPLNSLVSSQPATNILAYPSDLGSSQKAHVVQFFINEPLNQGTTAAALTYNNGIQNGFANVPPGYAVSGSSSPAVSVNTIFNVQVSTPTKRSTTTISLYMPDTVNNSYQAGYEDSNYSDNTLLKLGSGLSAFIDSIKDKGNMAGVNVIQQILAGAQKTQIGNILPVDALLKAGGVAINPQVQLLFKGVGLRTFQFDFTFTPKSQEETQQINSIIQTFRYHAAPVIQGNDAGSKLGLYFVVPSTFNIQYLFAGNTNQNIPLIGECVLESVSVDQAPNGWATFTDGSPVQTRLTLQFKEMDIIDKNAIQQGY